MTFNARVYDMEWY